jgi:hypothetical protein
VSAECSPCKASHYKASSGQHPCVRCSGNSESAVVGARLVSTCQCSAGYTGNISSTASRCHPCAAGSFKTTVGSAKCNSLDNAVSSVLSLVSAGDGVTHEAAQQLSVLSDSLGTEPSKESIAAREQLMGTLASAVPDPLTMDATAVSSTLSLLSSLTSSVDQLSDSATDNGFALATAMAKAPVGKSGCVNLASTVSNLFEATQKGFTPPAQGTGTEARDDGEAARDATRRRGELMGSILESIALTLTSNNTGDGEMSFGISTDAFELTAHRSVTLGGNISAAGASVALPNGGATRRRLASSAAGEDDFSLQMVRYAGAGPQLWAGNTLAHHGTETQMASDTLTVSMFGDAGQRIKLTLCNINESSSLCLDSPAQIRLPVTANLSDLSNSSVVHCAYWNVDRDEWVIDSQGQLMDDGTILCNTSHFTDFNTFIGPPPKFNRVHGLHSLADLPTANPLGFLISCLMLWLTVLLARYGAKDYRRLRKSLEVTEGDGREKYEADTAVFAAHQRHLVDPTVPWTKRAPGLLRTRWLAGSVW